MATQQMRSSGRGHIYNRVAPKCLKNLNSCFMSPSSGDNLNPQCESNVYSYSVSPRTSPASLPALVRRTMPRFNRETAEAQQTGAETFKFKVQVAGVFADPFFSLSSLLHSSTPSPFSLLFPYGSKKGSPRP